MPLPINTSDVYEQVMEQHLPLICGLPDDLAILCISRVPRQFHHILRCVSRRWRALLKSKDWHSCRQNLEETWVFAMCISNYKGTCYVLDPHPSRRSWKLLNPIPSRCVNREGMSFEALGNKLFLLGGCSCQEKATDEVYCYNASTGKWEDVASMPTARCYFLSAAIDNKIYITGGLGMSSKAWKSWDVFDYTSNSWSSHEDPCLIPDIVKAFLFDGKLYTIHKSWIDSQYARVYDPSSREWVDANLEMTCCARGPTVVVHGTLFMLDETCGTRLMMWRRETEEWVPLGRLSLALTKPPCQLVAVGKSIFIIGQNLSTVIVDIDKAASVEGVLVASSFAPKLDNDLFVVSCRTNAI
ncbi:hypothetical protein HPP92_008309 [Vanilla planifolia]|uniref:F-box domain-containing protein n=1 Tax=Vanilla planifolia TaxID=51239 RepID=A0A835R850_VANPL|nr:hypothetical protein HPP92_008309 [Vanilla planifolia]